MKSVTTDRHANARDRKRAKSREMVINNRGAFLTQAIIQAKAEEAARDIEARAKAKGRKKR